MHNTGKQAIWIEDPCSPETAPGGELSSQT